MSSEKRPLDDPAQAASGRVVVGSPSASRRRLRRGFARGLLAAAILCLVFAGCSVFHAAGPRPNKHRAGPTRPSAQRKELTHRKEAKKRKPLFSSLFRRQEPKPPESLQEWMDLEPVRP